MSNNIEVKFKVAGGALDQYIDSIKKKSQDLTNDAIKSALAQTEAGKQQLAVLNQIISATERKNKIETQAARSIALEQRERALKENAEKYDARKNTIFSDNKLSELNKKEHITALSGIETSESQRIKGDYRDNLTVLKEQEKQSKLQTILSREQVEAIKSTARDNVSAISRGDKKLEDVISSTATDEEKMIARLTEEEFKEKKHGKEEHSDKSIFNSLIKADLVRSVGGMMAQIPNAKNELDFIKPMSSLIGMSIGAALGTTIDMATGTKVLGSGIGQTNLGTLMADMGKVAGEFVGSSLERAYKGREELTSRNFALQALTGNNYNVDAFGSDNSGLGATGKSRITGNLSKYGVDYNQTSALQYLVAQKQGTSKNLDGGAENVIALEKGLGVSKDATFGIIDLLRSSTEGNKDFLKTISGILDAGKGGIFKEDRTFLGEFLGKFTSLQKELLKQQGVVATGTTMDLLSKFDSLGGQFSARDSRSGGLISSVNSALANPDSDFKKSLEYQVIRQKLGARASIADILQEQQKGASSKILMDGMMHLYSTMGDESTQRLSFASLVGGNVDAGTRLRKGYLEGKFNKLGTFGKNLKGILGQDAIRALGESQTGQYTRSSAEIENDFIDNVAEAVKGVGVKMEHLFGAMTTQLEDWIVAKIKGGKDADNKVTHNVPTVPAYRYKHK